METIEYWNDIGSKKIFEDPIYIDKIKPYVSYGAKVVEYGCGYGRMMNILKKEGYSDVVGFDFSKNMIERGKKTYPDFEMHILEESGEIPLESESVDFVVLSTILCCMVDLDQQMDLVEEIKRILKPNAFLYVSDFMINETSLYHEKYRKGFEQFGEWGVYTNSEGLTVRHHLSSWIMDLFNVFNVLWFEQFDFKTMNNNPAKTFHTLVQKSVNLHF